MEPLQKPLFLRRFGAFLIDHFIFTAIVVGSVFMMLDPTSSEVINNLKGSIMAAIVGASMLYWFKDIVAGRSIGKRIFGLGVREDDEHNRVPGAGKLILRNLFSFICVYSKE